MSNAANLGFAFRSPLVPPNAFMLVENLHQRKSVEASCAPQPVQVCRLLLVARKVRFFFWLRKRLLLLLVYAAELGWFRLALSKVADLADRPNGAEGSCLLVSFFLFFQIGSNTRGLVCVFRRSLSATSGKRQFSRFSLVLVPLPWRLLLHVLSRAAYLYSWSTTFPGR